MTPPTLDAAFVATALGARVRERRGLLDDRVRFERAVIDSRAVEPGDLFVALPGERVDGHDFVPQAVEAGASGCLLNRPVPAAEHAAVFVVDDTLAALQDLGAYWRIALHSTEVVGITGSVGKTTTKGIVAAVLAARYRVQANPLNYNNEISVPICLTELRPETERAVIEMGMYTRGEIALLCQWARPRTGVVLNVGPVHLERAGSIENITLAKRELVEALPADGHAVLNADDPRVREMAGHTPARIWRYGESPEAEVRGSDVVSYGPEGFALTLSYAGEQRRLRVPLAGRHLLHNVLAAAAAGFADGLTIDEVAGALEALDVPERLRVVQARSGARVVDDTYNAQPASMIAALDLLAEMPIEAGGRRFALLGDMLELGEVAIVEHRRVGEQAARVLDGLLTIGSLTPHLGAAASEAGLDDVHHVETRDAARQRLEALLGPGDVVLVKGSHALELDRLVEELTTGAEETR
jgi:UDP-N-acetylmuramoyl-tripeptide--D-alanyl-D-alanine ligase